MDGFQELLVYLDNAIQKDDGPTAARFQETAALLVSQSLLKKPCSRTYVDKLFETITKCIQKVKVIDVVFAPHHSACAAPGGCLPWRTILLICMPAQFKNVPVASGNA